MSGVHWSVTGLGCFSWIEAARQVLTGFCSGIPNPTAEQIQTTADALKQANVDHLNNDVWWVFSYNQSTPDGVDDRVFREFYSDTEIFIPTPVPLAICPAPTPPAPPVVTPPVVTPPVITPPVTPPPVTPPPPASDAGTAGTDTPPPQDTTPPPQDMTPPAVSGPSPREQAKKKLQTAIDRANSMVTFLTSKGATSFANNLVSQINTAQQVLNNPDSTKQQLQSAAAVLSAARVSACRQANDASLAGGGAGIQCPQ